MPSTRHLRRLPRPASLLALGLLLAWQPGGTAPGENLQPELRNWVPPPGEPPATLRVVSYNIHHGDDLPRLVESLRNNAKLNAADVYLIQEIESYESEGRSRAAKLAEALHLNYVYAPARLRENGGTHGLAVLSRFPLSDVEVLPLKQFNLRYNTRRRIALAATLDVAGRPLRVYNLHLDTRLNSKDRLEQLRPVAEAAVAQPVPAVVGGDFNTNAFRWFLHILPVFYSDQAGAVDELMQMKGFSAPLAEAGGTSRKALLRLRLDSLYARGTTVRAAGIEHSVDASDHAPVWMEITWEAPPASAE